MSDRAPGFRLPFSGQAPTEFFLPLESFFTLTLVRLCALAEPHIELGFVVDWVSPMEVRMRWRVLGREVPARVVLGDHPSATIDALRTLLAPLNAALEEGSVMWVVELPNAKPNAYAHYDIEYRLVLRPSASDAPLPSLPRPEDLLEDASQISSGSPYAGGLAHLASNLASKLLKEDFDIHPRGSRESSDTNFYGDESHLPITFAHSYLQTTVVMPHPYRDDGALELLKEIQERCDLEDRRAGWESGVEEPPTDPTRRKPYWLYVAPAAEHIVLANEAEATTLRRHGYLREGETAHKLWTWLMQCGAELPAMATTWIRLQHSMHAMFERVALMRPPSIAFHVEPREEHSTSPLVLRLHSQRLEFDFPEEWAGLLSRSILQWVLRRLNSALAESGTEYRVLHLGSRLVWLTVAWVGQILSVWPQHSRQMEPNFSATDNFPWPMAIPPIPEPGPMPASKRPKDIVGAQNVLDSDFKCSARQGDYPEVFDEIAEFADLAQHIKSVGLARRIGTDRYGFPVQQGAKEFEVVVSDHKYADVTPMVEVLNEVLTDRASPVRLYLFSGPGWEGGVLLATREQLEVLKLYRYV